MPTASRGTLYPERLPEFHRVPPPADLAAIVRWFWITGWQLDAGVVVRQPIIGYPALNLVVEDEVVGLSGPTTRASYRDLAGSGWAVAALLRPAAVAALTIDPVSLQDRYLALSEPELHQRVRQAMDSRPPDHGQAVAALASWLAHRVGQPSADALLANQLAQAAEEPGVYRVGDLAARLGVSQRTVQRLARAHIGLTPAAMIRRRRLQEAAERLREHPDSELAALAADLGYADQAHFTHEFTRVIGVTPGNYRRSRTVETED